MGTDSRQDRFEVESGADYLADFAEGFELAYRACQFVGSLIQFVKQAHVLDGNDRLVGEGFNEGDLLVSEGLYVIAVTYCDYTKQRVFFKQWYSQSSSY